MTPLAFDTETCLIRPAQLAPPMVCLTWQRPGHAPAIEHVFDARPRLESWLRDPNTLLTAHFAAYDMTVVCAEFPELVPLVFAKYRGGQVTCTKLRQQLLDIAGGVFRGVHRNGKFLPHKYDLRDLAKRHLGREMIKDGWRLEYASFRDVPLERWTERAAEVQARARARRAILPDLVNKDDPWADEVRNLDAIIADVPEGVIRYPLDDAEIELGVYLAQEKHAEYLKDQYRQAFAQFVLYLSSAWGLRTHGPGVEALRAELSEAYDELEEELLALGMVRENGTRDMKIIKARMVEACRVYGLPLRRTDAHLKCDKGDACDKHISLDADACDAVVSASIAGDGRRDDADVEAAEAFMSYAEFVSVGKMLHNDVKMLAAGTVYPVHTRYDMAETGRTTSSKPALQNLNTGRMKRGQEHRVSMKLRPGIRQAFMPRPGNVFIQADFPQLELYTLAQCCYKWLGYSKLGDMLNEGLDPHLSFAATLLDISYEEANKNKKRSDVDQARQIGKVFNFGKPGGMGNKKLKVWARKTYGVELTLEQLEQYTFTWHETLPEMRQYFARVNAMFGEDLERISIETLFTERHRGGATYCAACNNGFQALGVDCAKRALCLVAEAEYVGPGPLFGCRTVAFVHDEIIAECPSEPTSNGDVHDAAHELARLMVQGANEFLPDVPILLSKMEPTAMTVWSKEAKQVWSGEGSERLIPWSP